MKVSLIRRFIERRESDRLCFDFFNNRSGMTISDSRREVNNMGKRWQGS